MRHLTLRISDGAFVPSYLRTWSVEIPHFAFGYPLGVPQLYASFRTLVPSYALRCDVHSAFRIPHLTGTSDLSPAVAIANYQSLTPKTPLMREAFQLASLLAYAHCTSARPWR